MYENFENWLNDALTADIPDTAISLCFNIYEDGDNLWSVELVACDAFDPKDNDWASEEVFAGRETPFEWEEETEWENVLENVLDWVKKYLDEGKHSKELKEYRGIGAGFVDGDVHILHIKV